MWRRGLASVCLSGLISAVVAQGTTNLITGTIASDATWSGTNLLRGTVTIESNVTVNIDPGTRMLMNTGAVLMVRGQLLANGTSNAPILFTRATTTAPWGRILLDRAAPSRLRHCIIEHANSAGDHQSYYPSTSCNPPVFAPRNYHEAVVCLAGHLDLERCTFRNLPVAGGEGDAIAIISDHPDPTNTNSWNSASANIQGCQFLGIGQGVHTRYAYVLVENCFFTNKFGDNDCIDLYGESNPTPLIQNNLMFPNHEDAINPTRCSARIIGNIVAGGDDQGIVLRDKCSPIVMNNLVFSIRNGGISSQNQCDALLVNNTVVNCGIGLRFIFHSDRLTPPYCLANAGARATIINCVIWDCPTAITMNESDDPGSRALITFSNIEGGQGSIAVSGNSSYTWGNGNINADPLFVSTPLTNVHLRAGSPCIDSGTNVSLLVSNDFDRIPRPLDGNGDSLAAYDMGAYEFLLTTADSNGDGIPDGWTWQYGLNPTDPNVGSGNPDQDAHTTFQEWVADTNPIDPLSRFRIQSITAGLSNTVSFLSSSNRQYTLQHSPQIPAAWSSVTTRAGKGGVDSMSHTNGSQGFYRIRVDLP